MAVLKNNMDDTYIILNLKKIKESPAWIGYDLKILAKKLDKQIEFLKMYYKEEVLFFENSIDPEIPALYNALDSLSLEKINKYFFSPIDEDDFSLEINHIKKQNRNFYDMKLFVKYANILNSYEWNHYSNIGIQMKVSKEDIISFSNELKKEYQELLLN